RVSRGRRVLPHSRRAGAGEMIKEFRNIPEMMEAFRGVFPEAKITKAEGEELGVNIEIAGSKYFIPVRDAQGSGYYIVDIPGEPPVDGLPAAEFRIIK